MVKSLGSDIMGYYGHEVLKSFDAYNSGVCMWLSPLLRTKEINCRPVLHLLLMRFLAGSAEAFFAGDYEPGKKYQPYGVPPYPCRNVVCEHYLRDVIDNIELNNIKGNYRATFSCSHCGFTYRRKKPLPKEKQYSGQIDVCDYGELWHETLKNMLSAQTPIRRIGMALKCDTRTVVKLGIERGFFPSEQHPKLRPYLAHPKTEVSFDEQRGHYRKRWADAIAANPTITRKELRAMDSKADQWLHMYDADWVADNSPPSKSKLPKWAYNDDEYAERIENAAKQIRSSPGKPKRISVMALGKYSGIPKLYRILASGRLPKTHAAVKACSETPEQWQHKKIKWAVQQMRDSGEVITVYKVRRRATIEDPKRKLDEFITGCIMNNS
jgi:transposase-like protein